VLREAGNNEESKLREKQGEVKHLTSMKVWRATKMDGSRMRRIIFQSWRVLEIATQENYSVILLASN
jgi:hypothetical protein